MRAFEDCAYSQLLDVIRYNSPGSDMPRPEAEVSVEELAREHLFDSVKKELGSPPTAPAKGLNLQVDLKSITVALAACAQLIGRTPREMSPADIQCIADNAKLLGAELFQPTTNLGGEE